jgi:hypothetical protein
MPMPIWPATLQIKALYDGYNFTPHDSYKQTIFENGAMRNRSWTSPQPAMLKMKVNWGNLEYEEFQRFYYETLENGTLYFTMPVIVNSEYIPANVRIMEPPIPQYTAHFNYEEELTLELREFTYTGSASQWFTENYGSENAEIWHNIVKEAVEDYSDSTKTII